MYNEECAIYDESGCIVGCDSSFMLAFKSEYEEIYSVGRIGVGGIDFRFADEFGLKKLFLKNVVLEYDCIS